MPSQLSEEQSLILQYRYRCKVKHVSFVSFATTAYGSQDQFGVVTMIGCAARSTRLLSGGQNDSACGSCAHLHDSDVFAVRWECIVEKGFNYRLCYEPQCQAVRVVLQLPSNALNFAHFERETEASSRRSCHRSFGRHTSLLR